MGNNHSTLAKELGDKLKAKGLTIATAESCTAGAIGAAIASVNGASAYFVGGVIVYATRLKTEILGVDADCIANHGVVSRETAVAMNEGVRKVTQSDLAISITGYAGATGGDEFAENGTIWICACMNGHEPSTRCLKVDGARDTNLQLAVDEALKLTLEYIENEG